MVSFHSFISLPEGKPTYCWLQGHLGPTLLAAARAAPCTHRHGRGPPQPVFCHGDTPGYHPFLSIYRMLYIYTWIISIHL